MTNQETGQKSKFSAQFWLVILFEFFERGSYYGMMSFLSVYFSDTLNIPKENVGIIKGVIQPLLYFLPIVSGAIADRFGYRKMLLIAFTLLGGGYFLTSQMTSYSMVFIALVIMGFGAGIFKPIITGTIASVTDESNSTQAFGIYYWSINLGAFLFPLILVPWLKGINPSLVIVAAGICTAAMIIPTIFFFKDPELKQKVEKREQMSLIQTIANSFEIIYSPVVLLLGLLKRTVPRFLIIIALILGIGFSLNSYLSKQSVTEIYPKIGAGKNNQVLYFDVNRNMLKEKPYKIETLKEGPIRHHLTVYNPDSVTQNSNDILSELHQIDGFSDANAADLNRWIQQSLDKIRITVITDASIDSPFKIDRNELMVKIVLKDSDRPIDYTSILNSLHQDPLMSGISEKDLSKLFDRLETRPFFMLFVFIIIIATMLVVSFKRKASVQPETVANKNPGMNLSALIVPAIIIAIWFMPGINLLAKIIATVITLSVLSLFIINTDDYKKFVQHSKFLLMIVIYSIFWVLYFQMFDSVLWYVQAYVDASALNNAVNGFLNMIGIQINWFFDVEHVTVINAGTIILLQLVISNLVKKKKALPTMVTGISIATIGMGILAISTHIWVFIIGIFLFSIGEMTAHPKFISYVGLIAPSDNKALYMGYIFLYGVFGASVGGIVGAQLYVHFVDNLNNPSLLWIVFSGIGVLGIIGLLLYNKFLLPKSDENSTTVAAK